MSAQPVTLVSQPSTESKSVVEDHTLHEDLVAMLAARLKPRRYLEFGVHKNETMLKVRKVASASLFAVDIHEPPMRVPLVRYFIKTTQEFLKDDAPGYAPFDLVFIDADHRYESAKFDFHGIWPYVAEQGLVMLHDTFPKDKEATDPGFCGDSYRFAEELRRDGQECVTLPFHPGLTIVRKAQRHLTWSG